jgi:hypothetical protein
MQYIILKIQLFQKLEGGFKGGGREEGGRNRYHIRTQVTGGGRVGDMGKGS